MEEDNNVPEPPESPGWVNTFNWGLYHLQSNWAALVKPGVILTIFIASGAAYWLGSNKSAEVVEVKNERISFLTDQITAYKDRLQGATPDEAAKRFSTLEKIISKQQSKLEILEPTHPRHLNDKAKADLIKLSDRLKKDIKTLAIFAYPIGDSEPYAGEFFDLFSKIPLPVLGIEQSACSSDERGVVVGVINTNVLSSEALDFIDILKSVGLKPTTTKWNMTQWPQDFDLFICPDVSIDPQVEPPLIQAQPSTPAAK